MLELGALTDTSGRDLELLRYPGESQHEQPGMFFKPARFSDDASQHEIIRERGAGLIRAAYDRIEGHLEGRDFFVGDAETTVDYYTTIFWYWGHKYGFEAKEKYPNYTRLVARMEQKASLRAAAEAEGVPLSTA
jgi:glutathione S-transferase